MIRYVLGAVGDRVVPERARVGDEEREHRGEEDAREGRAGPVEDPPRDAHRQAA